MRKTTIVHEPRSGKARPYTYTALTFDSLKEAWGHFKLGVNDTRAQLAFLSREATRRERERANASVNAPNAPKPVEQKLLNNAVRIVNAPRHLVEKAKAGDVGAQAAIIEQYRDVLKSLEESPLGVDPSSAH